MDPLTSHTPPTPIPFSQQPGPRVNLPATAPPLQFFDLFFNDAIITLLKDGTNEYAAMVIVEDRAGKLTPHSRWRKWKPVTLEMKVVLAIINMGLIHCPEVEDYWKCSWESYIPSFHDILPRNRFQKVFWMLHLPVQPAGQTTYQLDKLQPLLNILLGSFQSSFYPGCEVSVDESMVGFKGKVSFKQYCPLKQTKHGLKAFVLCDSRTGYVLNIIPCTGREVREQYLSLVSQDIPMLAQIVVALCEKYLKKGHHVFADRLYSSVPLVDEL